MSDFQSFFHFKINPFINRKILNEFKIHPFHLSQQFLIVATREGNEFEIFEIAMHYGLVQVNALINDQNRQIWTLYTYKSRLNANIRNCHSFEVLKVETFTSKNFTNELNFTFHETVVPMEQFMLKNCPIFIATFSIPPFVIIQKSNDGSIQYDGIDVTIVNEISRALNVIPIYVQASDKKNRGILYPNGTATGAIKMVSIFPLCN